jgi:hypothetical protein
MRGFIDYPPLELNRIGTAHPGYRPGRTDCWFMPFLLMKRLAVRSSLGC